MIVLNETLLEVTKNKLEKEKQISFQKMTTIAKRKGKASIRADQESGNLE